MTDLERQASEYANDRMAHYPDVRILRFDVRALVEEAYEQGWVDRDTRDMKPETSEEFFGEDKYVLAEDCQWYDRAICRKGLPNITGCNLRGCVCYTPKNEKK